MKTLLLPITVALALSSCGSVNELTSAKPVTDGSIDTPTKTATPADLEKSPQNPTSVATTLEQQQDAKIAVGLEVWKSLRIIRKNLCANITDVNSSAPLMTPTDTDPSMFTPSGNSMLRNLEVTTRSINLAPNGQAAFVGFASKVRLGVAWYTASGLPIALKAVDVEAPFDSEGTQAHFDRNNNLLVAGFSGGRSFRNANFDAPYTNTFVMKFNQDRQCVWGFEFSQEGLPTAPRVSSDAEGNIFFASTATGLPGMKFVGQQDAFVLKLSPDGQPIWLRTLGGDGADMLSSIATDDAGNLNLIGSSLSTNLRGWSALGKGDLFAASLTNAGALRWARLLGSAEEDQAAKLSVHGTDLLVAGSSRGSFGGIANPTQMSAPINGKPASLSGFAMRVSETGKVIWSVTARQIQDAPVTSASTSPDSLDDVPAIQSLCVLSNDTVLLTGAGMRAPKAIAFDWNVGSERGTRKYKSGNVDVDWSMSLADLASETVCDPNRRAVGFSRVSQSGPNADFGYYPHVLDLNEIR
jgi:hypothetical protein